VAQLGVGDFSFEFKELKMFSVTGHNGSERCAAPACLHTTYVRIETAMQYSEV
jgi:hypothetical protein